MDHVKSWANTHTHTPTHTHLQVDVDGADCWTDDFMMIEFGWVAWASPIQLQVNDIHLEPRVVQPCKFNIFKRSFINWCLFNL